MINKICTIWWCENKHYAKGYCIKHYRSFKRTGSPYGKNKALMERIEKEIDKLKLEIKLLKELLGEY
jgi:hypothetical protein